MKSLPYFCRGEVIQGFGRGSKELGIPTANFPDSVVDNLPADISTGIYYGWACIGNGDVYKMVMSIGWNPYYKNTKKSMETHVIHKFKEDFYGQTLSVVLVGYIRSEKSFPSLEDLIAAINSDIEEAKVKLELPEHSKLKEDNFFTSTTNSPPVSSSSAASTSQSIINANFPDSVVDNLPADISTRIYYGWACISNGDVYKMVMSISWNPYYKNTKKFMVKEYMPQRGSLMKNNLLHQAGSNFLRLHQRFFLGLVSVFLAYCAFYYFILPTPSAAEFLLEKF